MTTLVQLEQRNFNNGLLPPSTELYLEIQVNNLIQEYLFSSNADERRTSLHEGSSDYKENNLAFMAPNHFRAMDMALNSSCAKSVQALDDHHKQNPRHMQTSQAPLTHHSITGMEYNSVSSEGDMVIGKALQATNTAHGPRLTALSVESECKLMRKTPLLSRVDTFPCTGKAQLKVGTPSKANLATNAGYKKPPRPPRLPKSELSSSLKRCCSDSAAYLQSSRRAKLERKRKATATSSVNTSIWALLFTFCCAIIMIAQGFWSQDSQNFTTHGGNATSPMVTLIVSRLHSPEEPNTCRFFMSFLCGKAFRHKQGLLHQIWTSNASRTYAGKQVLRRSQRRIVWQERLREKLARRVFWPTPT